MIELDSAFGRMTAWRAEALLVGGYEPLILLHAAFFRVCGKTVLRVSDSACTLDLIAYSVCGATVKLQHVFPCLKLGREWLSPAVVVRPVVPAVMNDAPRNGIKLRQNNWIRFPQSSGSAGRP